MAKTNQITTMRVRIKIDPDHPGRGLILGPGKRAKPGEVVELNRWLALHEIAAGICEEVK